MTEQDHDHEKSVKMPTKEEMIARLTMVGVYGLIRESDAFFDHFTESVGNTEEVGKRLAEVWATGERDWLSDSTPMMKALINRSYGAVIDVITPDTDVAAKAKQAIQEARQAIKGAGLRNQPS